MWKIILLSVFIQAAGKEKVKPVASPVPPPAGKTTPAAKVEGGAASSVMNGKILVSVNGMVCSFCAQGIEKKFKAQKSVETVAVDLDNKKVTLQLKKGETISDETIKEIITNEAGYELVKIQRE
jgi:mercuric ion binding protein